ncbi:DNA-directed DNA polymerase [Xylanimonas cellulosilytica DSM 15894]|uniref:DNA-directed DNA polymerase n=1 Tax=Xylanimonas cellulosilytica (strain DSM 15894 / JCM 12276 / CECT 5975 / KCTC 9989 / LMG 20990 / NBRC 107835 / XIL07) TaxID=446471 RepID=D1BU92_XYLCX|nr:bifunctional 3'-5' exonuclease/DNA polymerase [Xylanimonas cellulosilytica]ACZ31105.1 DNA-directed DNA polymerase [Xylanimonas cellulosilytica DSM 15894]
MFQVVGEAERAGGLSAVVRDGDPETRWAWDDTNRWYPGLLDDGVRVERAHDLRLAHAILRRSPLTAHTPFARAPAGPWDRLEPAPAGPPPPVPGLAPKAEGLFDLDDASPGPYDGLDPAAELRAQEAAVADARDPGRLRFLLAAESAGALVAAELHHTGLPWRADVHDAILTQRLGPRPPFGQRPARLEALAVRIRELLDAPPTLNPDSHPSLLKALQYAGIGVRSLSQWELMEVQHPVVEPLMEYKKLSRLLTANGWNWLDTWVRDGRFRSEYVVGGVVTGRWSSVGGGALQLPKEVRRAVVADPGWTLVVADVAQLEPRVLAAMSRDDAMAAAGRGGDMYAGIVASGAVATRDLAKVGMLGAMYGGTTGASAQVLPSLARTFPRAIALVEDAARAGERGEVVSTWLGRGSPRPGADWERAQAGAYDADDGARARSYTRSFGRFTRNFVVQGTAAEWALAWLASARRRLWALGEHGTGDGVFANRPHLAFFLHDEVVVHTPAAMADDVARELREAAAEAGRLLFGDYPVEFPLTVATVDSYADAK